MLTIGAEHEAVLKECEATYSMLDELRAEHRRQLASAEARAREEKAAALLRQRHAAQQTVSLFYVLLHLHLRILLSHANLI